MDRKKIQDWICQFENKSIGVVGDFCLDAYWFIDESRSENSLETNLATMPVKEARYGLGGAGNVCANLTALGVGGVSAYGVIGKDMFAWEMLQQLKKASVQLSGLKVQRRPWLTPVYVKRILDGKEIQRIDLGNFNRLSRNSESEVLAELKKDLPELDLLIINQQMINGLHSPTFIRELNRLIKPLRSKLVITDARRISDAYPNTIRKMNDKEAVRIYRRAGDSKFVLSPGEDRDAALWLYHYYGKPVLVTRGEKGCIVCDESGVELIGGIPAHGPVDPVGGGDSMLAGLAAGLTIGLSVPAAAQLGNLMAGVTIRKLFQTGTATPEEILDLLE